VQPADLDPAAPSPADSDEEDEPLELGPLALRVVIGLVVLFLIAMGVSFVWGDELSRLGGWAARTFGSGFVFVGVLLIDSSPFPLVNEPLLLLGLSGGLDIRALALATVSGSLLAAWVGYGCGLLLAKRGLSERVLGRHHQRGERFVRRYGFWGVALAALTPLPFGLCTWTAGALRMPWLTFAAASSLRAPKAAFYLWVVYSAWRLSAKGS